MEKRKVVKCVIDEDGRLGITAMGLVDMPAIEENWIALSKMQFVRSSCLRIDQVLIHYHE